MVAQITLGMPDVRDDFVPMRGPRVMLRPLEISDASERYAAWLNDREVNEYLETHSATIEQLQSYIKEKRANPEVLFLGIFWSATNQHIGNVKLEPFDVANSTAHLGLLIGEKDFWGKGIATEVMIFLTRELCTRFGIHTVTLGVIAQNAAALRVYEKCGFHEYKREVLLRGGKPYDNIFFTRVCEHGSSV